MQTGANGRPGNQAAMQIPARPARADVYSLLLIAAGFVLALVLMPPEHRFAYLDDFTYANGVQSVLAGQGFHPSQYAQATLVFPTYWGAAFAWLLGYSFTTLTVATMALSLIAALTFYVLLRRLGCAPSLAGLGVAILALNPYYLVLSYSFMTEIPFVALLLLSCLCYFEGLRSDRLPWLLLGGACAALAFLTRQFGLVTPLAALLWLAAARKLTWSRLFALGLLPALVALGYFAATSRVGPTFSGSVGREELLALLRPFTWLNRASHFVYLAAFLPGITIPLWGRVRHPRTSALLAGLTAAAVYGIWQVKGSLVDAGQSTINDLSYTWLVPPFADPTPIYCLGAALSVWLVAGLVERAWPGARALWRRARPLTPVDFLYLVAAILFAGTYLVSAGFLDRYWLPLFPFLIAGGLTGIRAASWRRLAPAGPALLVIASYGIAMHLDDYALYTAYWDAGTRLVQAGVPYEQIRSYTGWEAYYLYDAALARLGSHDIAQIGRIFPPDTIIDPAYVVGPSAPPGYTVLARYPYLSLRNGFQTLTILVSRRAAGAARAGHGIISPSGWPRPPDYGGVGPLYDHDHPTRDTPAIQRHPAHRGHRAL